LSVREAELGPSSSEAISQWKSSPTKSLAVMLREAEQPGSADDHVPAESLALVTDHVMADWDVSEWWSTETVVDKRKDEAI
jgi:hypothetical protein